jgi:hypothetical protein
MNANSTGATLEKYWWVKEGAKGFLGGAVGGAAGEGVHWLMSNSAKVTSAVIGAGVGAFAFYKLDSRRNERSIKTRACFILLGAALGAGAGYAFGLTADQHHWFAQQQAQAQAQGSTAKVGPHQAPPSGQQFQQQSSSVSSGSDAVNSGHQVTSSQNTYDLEADLRKRLPKIPPRSYQPVVPAVESLQTLDATKNALQDLVDNGKLVSDSSALKLVKHALSTSNPHDYLAALKAAELQLDWGLGKDQATHTLSQQLRAIGVSFGKAHMMEGDINYRMMFRDMSDAAKLWNLSPAPV